MTSIRTPSNDPSLVGTFTAEGMPRWFSWPVTGALSVLIILPLTLWEAFAVEKVWNWHLTSLGFPEMTMTAAIALSMIVSMMAMQTKYKITGKDITFDVDLKKTLQNQIFLPAIMLVIGYIMYRWF